MKHIHLLTIIGALAIGLGLGYLLGDMSPRTAKTTTSEHVMTNTMDDMTSGLAGKTGDDFDKAFITEMIAHHEGAVAMAQHVLATSKRPELIKLAHDIITAQTGEIVMMHDWYATWFK